MARDRLSKRTVDRLTCPADKDRVFLWDDALSGFGVAAFPTGKKVYVVQFRRDGRSRRATVGDHGRLTPEEARSEAKKLLGSVEQGHDPVAAKRAAAAVPTFREIADDFMARHVKAKKKPRTYESYETLLRAHILPAIGAKRVTEIRRAQISKLHHGMTDTPGAGNRALSVISAIWNWAAAEHEGVDFGRNPAEGIERYGERGRERFLSEQELSRMGDTLIQAETVGLPYVVDEKGPKAKHAPKPENRIRHVDPYAVAAIRLLMLTGARRNEILTAKWEYLDLRRGLLNLPDSKTGKKPIYLSTAAIAVLTGLARRNDTPFIIPGQRPGTHRADLKNPWTAITTAANLPGLRLHDLRHSFASFGAGASLGLPIIGKLLGHTQPATTARYAHLDADPIRRAVDTIGETIAAALAGSGGQPAAPVPVRRRRRG